MIIREFTEIKRNEVHYIMSDAVILAASIKTSLIEIAKQAAALGNGLQNAALGDTTGSPNNSVSYLLSTSENLLKMAEECGRLSGSN
jgi:hypothetical protein